MLLFATEDDGQIMVIKTLAGISYQAGKTVLESNQKPRELAFWSDAIEQLLKQGYIKTEGTNNVYRIEIGSDTRALMGVLT